MYLHLGQNTVVPARTIIGLFDLDICTQKKATRTFLARSEKNGQVREVSDNLPRSFILCSEKEKSRVYLSQISVATLRKRCLQGYYEE